MFIRSWSIRLPLVIMWQPQTNLMWNITNLDISLCLHISAPPCLLTPLQRNLFLFSPIKISNKILTLFPCFLPQQVNLFSTVNKTTLFLYSESVSHQSANLKSLNQRFPTLVLDERHPVCFSCLILIISSCSAEAC